MKKIYTLFLIIMLFVGGFMTSCYDDNSTLDVNDIPGVIIDTTGQEKLSVYQYEHLVVNPNISSIGISEGNLVYNWKINVQPNDTNFIVIGEEKNLDYEVLLKPNEGNKTYQLLYTVTDISRDLKYMMSWPTTVKNNIGEGLVIAETIEGSKTDLSLIMAPEVTADYENVKILKNLFSVNNDGLVIDGFVKQMRFTNIYGSDALLAITDNSLTRINTFDYSYGGMNDDMFFASKDSYSPQLLGGLQQGDIYVGNNQLTGVWLGVSNRFGLPFDFSFQVPDHVAMNPAQATIAINFFDESINGFVYLPSIASYADHDMHAIPSVSGSVFDPASIPNKENVAAATNLDGDFLHLLRDKTTNDIALYILDGGAYEYPNYIPPKPKALIDLSSAPDIDNATMFVFLDNQKVMYYATSSKIYAMMYSTSTPIFEERYTATSGEEITTLQVYNQAGYPNGSDYISTNNKQLIMSTYSSLGGKVYLLPFINIGAGNIDEANIKSFDGFGHITAIVPQK